MRARIHGEGLSHSGEEEQPPEQAYRGAMQG
jgi:hypothetical protein